MNEDIEQQKKEAKEVKEDSPKRIKKEFLYRKGNIQSLFKKIKITAEELQKNEPILLYMTEDFKIIPYDKVKPGILKTKKKGITNKIDSVKIHELDYAGVPIKVYIMHEKELTCYPTNTKLDSKQVHDIIMGIKSNDASLNETPWLFNLSQKQIQNILLLLAGLVGIPIAAYYVGNIFGIWEALGWFQPETTNQIIKTVNDTIINAGGGIGTLK